MYLCVKSMHYKAFVTNTFVLIDISYNRFYVNIRLCAKNILLQVDLLKRSIRIFKIWIIFIQTSKLQTKTIFR